MKILNRLNKNEKILLTIIGALVAIWFVYNSIIKPVYNKWVSADKELEIANIELKKAKLILEHKEDVSREYDSYIDRFAIKASEEEEMALILNEIENQARNSSVRITNMKPRRVQKNGFYTLYYVDLDTEATMQNILKFIKNLKDSKPCLCVEQITLNSRTSEPSILNGTMVVSRLGIILKETPQNR